jgi:ADP-heptose:LPS heptosyltransferase
MSEHVLVVRPDNAGDVLLAGPAVRAAASTATVTLLCGPEGRHAAGLLPGVSSCTVARLPWIDPHPRPVDRSASMDLIDHIASIGFEKAVILTSFHQSPLPTALVLKLARIPFVGAISEDYPGSLLDVRHRVPDDIHEVTRGLSLMEACGFELPPDDDGALRVMELPPSPLPEGFGPYVVVHPGASVPARRPPPGLSAELVRALTRSGWRVVVTGSPSERLLTKFVTGEAGENVIDAGGATGFGQLAAIIANSQAIVVGNTGPAHVAAAVGTPVVSIYAPTVPAVRWRPWQVPHVLLGRQDIACQGCRARDCPIEGHPCVSSVTVAGVLDALTRVVDSTQPVAMSGTRS